MSALDKILENKKQEVEVLRQRSAELKSVKRQRAILDLESAIQEPGIQVIAEVKRKSPSEGAIRERGFDPVAIAASYEANGACAISVLTDQEHFGGSLEFLKSIKEAVEIPVLRKDFIIDELQVYESYEAGADAILLIADILEDQQLIDLHELSNDLGMGVLLELHDRARLEAVLKAEPEIIGVNCRDLKTMQTSLDYLESLVGDLRGCAKVAESGIQNGEDLLRVSEMGYHGALIGTSLMRSGSPGVALGEFLDRARD